MTGEQTTPDATGRRYDETDEPDLAVFGPETGAGGREMAATPLAAFLTAAHELRSPLAWLLGEVEGLSEQTAGPLNPAQLRVTRRIAGMCARMQRTVEECFAYGRLESGEVSFQAELCDLDGLMTELAAAWAPAFAKAGVALLAAAKGRLEPLPCDPHKLQRVVSILLENAVKFTPAGGEVELVWQPCVWSREEAGADGSGPPPRANAVWISVRDTGPGVAPENQQEIFEPFVSLSRGAASPGLGLGLAVARRLVQWHGGKIWVESAPPSGCTFAVMLPLQAV
ncbi:MAG TPA: HAMP domain-containing sensor histidine kinase [Terriglobales bacterium]|nr:HAMP domain-containing sensor histidine kinase [Terriglobales bacterium]